MKKRLIFAAVAATLALSACDKKPTQVVNTDPNSANFTAPAKPVDLPPAVKSSKPYRCKDDSIVTVNLFQGDKQANLREGNGAPVILKAEEAGQPLIADGYALTVKGDAITLTRPGHPEQDCVS